MIGSRKKGDSSALCVICTYFNGNDDANIAVLFSSRESCFELWKKNQRAIMALAFCLMVGTDLA